MHPRGVTRHRQINDDLYLAFYLALVKKEDVLVFRELSTGKCFFYLGHENNQVVFLTKSGCSTNDATDFYNNLVKPGGVERERKVWLLLDGLAYVRVPERFMDFQLLATSQQVDLKSQSREYFYRCLFPCWRQQDIFALGKTLFNLSDADMKSRYFVSGGSVREFTMKTISDIKDSILDTTGSIGDTTKLLSDAAFVKTDGKQVDRVRRTFIGEEEEDAINEDEGKDPDVEAFNKKMTRYCASVHWEQVVDSEFALEILYQRMRSGTLKQIFDWARRTKNGSLAGCMFEFYIHRLAAENMLVIHATPYLTRKERTSRQYPTRFEYWNMCKGASVWAGDKDDYTQVLTTWRSKTTHAYWHPKDREFPNIDSIVRVQKTVPAGSNFHEKKASVVYLQITVAKSHSVDSKQLKEMNSIFEVPCQSKQASDAIQVSPCAHVPDDYPMSGDVEDVVTSDVKKIALREKSKAQMEPDVEMRREEITPAEPTDPPVYVVLCPDEESSREIVLEPPPEVLAARSECKIYVAYYSHLAISETDIDVVSTEHPTAVYSASKRARVTPG